MPTRRSIVPKPLRLSDLSPARQALVRLCQTINHGSSEDLKVRRSNPTFDPVPIALKDIKLDSDEGPRPELTLADFVLNDEVLRLMSLLDEMRFGTVRRIEVRAGIPRRIVLESQVMGAVDLGPQRVGEPR
jgi:hypothetical protein